MNCLKLLNMQLLIAQRVHSLSKSYTWRL